MLPSIFKAYDIRGVYPTDFSNRLAYHVGRALVMYTGATKVVLGYDARTSTPALLSEMREGLLDAGVTVIDIGLVTTPMFSFAVVSEPDAAGVMITASHNPPQYNGFKLFRKGTEDIGGKTGLQEIAAIIERGIPAPSGKRGEIIVRDVLPAYLAKVFFVAGVAALDAHIGIDVGNGMAGVPLPAFLARSGIRAEVLYGEVDCSFPNHEANPVKLETLSELQRLVREKQLLFGAAFDGDADRVGFVDETGAYVPGDILGAFLAQELLRDEPGSLILGTSNSGRMLREAVLAAGGRFDLVPVGRANVKDRVRSAGALFAAEMSCHFYYRDFFNVESTLLTILLVTKAILRAGKPFSELLAPLRAYAASGELNFAVSDAKETLAAIDSHFGPDAASIHREDGLRMEFGDWMFSLRASNTEPLVRLNLEADTPALMEEKREVLRGFLR